MLNVRRKEELIRKAGVLLETFSTNIEGLPKLANSLIKIAEYSVTSTSCKKAAYNIAVNVWRIPREIAEIYAKATRWLYLIKAEFGIDVFFGVIDGAKEERANQ